MSHDIKKNETHAVVGVNLAIHSQDADWIADGLNEILRPLVGEGFIADYEFLNTENPTLVESSCEPEEGELFETPTYSSQLEDILVSLIQATEEAGGLIQFTDGKFGTATNPADTALGKVILDASNLLEKNNIQPKLYIDEADGSSLEVG